MPPAKGGRVKGCCGGVVSAPAFGVKGPLHVARKRQQ